LLSVLFTTIGGEYGRKNRGHQGSIVEDLFFEAFKDFFKSV